MQSKGSRETKRGRGAKGLTVRNQDQREILLRGLSQPTQPLALGITFYVVPAVRHVVADQEHLDLMASVRPAVPDHADVGCVIGMRLTPVVEQVVDDRIEPLLGRIPRLQQVVVKSDVIDRLDRDIGVGVRGEEQQLRAGRLVRRLLEHFNAGHFRHPLVRRDQRHRLVADRESSQHIQRLSTRRCPDDSVIGPVLVAEVARNRRRDQRIVVDGQDRRFAHRTAFE
jgi:hypothetical protein